jgi:hypothetical protein
MANNGDIDGFNYLVGGLEHVVLFHIIWNNNPN